MNNKIIFFLTSFLVLFNFLPMWADKSVVSVESLPLEISDTKWIYLQFKSDVKYADRGSDDISIQITNVPSVVRIKGNIPSFERTTITIISLDGVLHTYNLTFNRNPQVIAYSVENDGIHPIENYNMELTHRQTSHIIFPCKVVDIQCGTESIIADMTEDIDNIVKCKSVVEDFDYFTETSLTVVTENLKVYPFLIKYKEYPDLVNVQLTEKNKDTDAIFSSLSINEPEMKKLGLQVIDNGCVLRGFGTITDKMGFSLDGIYIKNDVMMYFLKIENASKVDYDIDFIKCFVVNKKTSKNQAFQADEKVPLFIYSDNPDNIIKAGCTQSVVFFYKRFTIPHKHSLKFELFEKNGGRHLKFFVSNKVLLQSCNILK